MGHQYQYQYHGCRSLLLAATALAFVISVDARPSPLAGNETIVHRDDSEVICTRSNWFDVLWFFFTNYLMHALSVRSLPGENFCTSVAFKLCCLLVPYTGLRRGLCLISRANTLAGNDLQAAARANALCMVVRTPDWRPENGDEIKNCKVEVAEGTSQSRSAAEDEKTESPNETCSGSTEAVTSDVADQGDGTGTVILQMRDPYLPSPAPRFAEKMFRVFVQTWRFSSQTPSDEKRIDCGNIKVHGLCRLAPGYALSYVPEDVKVFPRSSPEADRSLISAFLSRIDGGPVGRTKVASTHDAPRILFSLAQTASGAYALYRAKGSQIDRYGYAAFGLTVVPYMVISIFNFVGSLLTSEYEMLYQVRSDIMDEMVRRGGMTDGVVGTLNATQGDEEGPGEGVERVEPGGTSLQFQYTGVHLRFRDPAMQHPFSENLTITELPPQEKVKVSLRSRAYWSTILRGFYYWLAPEPIRKPAAKPPANTTVISIPTYGPFARLPAPFYQTYLNGVTVILLLFAFVTPYMVVYALSHFKLGDKSTSSQRTFTLNWLICGQTLGYVVGNVERLTGKIAAMRGLLLVFVAYGSYCLAGFVTVAQEILEFGTCKAV